MKTSKKLAILASAFVFVAGMGVGMNINKIAPGASMTISADDAVFEGFKYVLKDGEVTITGYTEDLDLTNVVIPDEIEGNPVTRIGKDAFRNCTKISSLDLRNVTHVEDYAFYGCKGITTLNMGSSLTSLGDCSFASISNVVVTIPESKITATGSQIFNNTNISEIHIPASTTEINSVFYTHNTLKVISVTEGNKNYVSDKGVLYTADKKTLIKCPVKTELTDYTTLEGTETIADDAFRSTSLKNLVISDTVKSIGAYSISYCNYLETLKLGKNVTSLGKYALAASKIKEVTTPDNIKVVGDYAIKNADISIVNVSASTINVYSDFLINESTEKFKVETGNKKYSVDDNGVLYNIDKTTLIRYPAASQLNEYIVLDGTEVIGSNAFFSSKLQTLIVADSVKTVEDYAFTNCYKLKKINLGKNATTFGKEVLAISNFLTNLTIEEVIIPDNLEIINKNTFQSYGPIYIEKLTVPASVVNIPDIFYQNQPRLTEINVDSKNKIYSSIDGILYSTKEATLIKCPTASNTIIHEIPDTIKTIQASAFEKTIIQNILIPASVTEIGANAFSNSKLNTIEGYTGSLAETYATENKYKFVSLGDAPNVPSTPDEPSDPGTDEPSNPGTDKPSDPNEGQEPFYDVNRDGKINIMDLAKLKTHLLLG